MKRLEDLMNKEIWKYAIGIGDYTTISMPAGAQVLTVRTQRSSPQLWALVDPSASLETRKFRLAGTGHVIEERIRQYIGTFQILGGDLVFHLFEIEGE